MVSPFAGPEHAADKGAGHLDRKVSVVWKKDPPQHLDRGKQDGNRCPASGQPWNFFHINMVIQTLSVTASFSHSH